MVRWGCLPLAGSILGVPSADIFPGLGRTLSWLSLLCVTNPLADDLPINSLLWRRQLRDSTAMAEAQSRAGRFRLQTGQDR